MDPEVYLAVIKLLIYYDEKLPDGTVTKSVKRITLDTEPCTLAHFGSAQESVKDLPLSTLHCINPKQSSLEKVELAGKEDFSTYKILKIEIQQCKNTTNTSTCKPIEEITKKLTLSWINIIYMQSAINPQNFTDPNQRFAATYTTMLSPAMLKSGIIKLNHLNVVDDDGWLFESKKTKKFIKADNAIENFNLQPDSRYIYSGIFELGQLRTTYERQYTRIQTVLAQIQGSAATVILALVIILRPYSQVKFREVLINELFDVKIKRKDSPTTKKKNGNRTPKKKNPKPQKSRTLLTEKELAKSPKNQAIDLKASKINSQELTERNRLFSLASDRPLISPRDKPEEKEEEKALTTKFQSFKTILNSIENDHEKKLSAENTEKKSLADSIEKKVLFEQASPDTMRKSTNPGQSLAIDKPGKIKLMALSDMISDGPDSPRNVSEISMKEEKREEEEDRKSAQAENNILQLTIPPISPRTGTEMISLDMPEVKENDEKEVPEDEEEEVDEGEDEDETQDEGDLEYESRKIDISIWEYFSSFVRKSQQTKEKFDVLDKGMKNVRERMDILNIMKKFRELDKLKALLLEEDQLVLFNAMPKAQIRPGEPEMTANELLLNKRSFSQRILKKAAFIEMRENQESMKKAYNNLRMKSDKSKIDTRLLELYNNMQTSKNQ